MRHLHMPRHIISPGKRLMSTGVGPTFTRREKGEPVWPFGRMSSVPPEWGRSRQRFRIALRKSLAL
jgi:hypothetical protein